MGLIMSKGKISTKITHKKIILHSNYPCHPNNNVRFEWWFGVPVQKHERVCPVCKFKWDIEITLISEKSNIYVHKLEWD